MFSKFTVEEKMLVCALINDFIQDTKTNALFGGTYSVLNLFGKMPPALANMLTTCTAYLHGTGLGEDMIKNAQISKFVWENMSIENKRTFLLAMFEIMELPGIRDYPSLRMGIACSIRDTLQKVDDSIICNVYTCEFICDRYGIRTSQKDINM